MITWKMLITTSKTMVKLSQIKTLSLMEVDIMCDFEFQVAKEVMVLAVLLNSSFGIIGSVVTVPGCCNSVGDCSFLNPPPRRWVVYSVLGSHSGCYFHKTRKYSDSTLFDKVNK